MREVVTTFARGSFDRDQVLRAKHGRRVSVVVPARDEAATVAGVIEAIIALREHVGLIDEIIVVDDASSDDTARVAAAAGAAVVGLSHSSGKGRAMAAGLDASEGDVIVYLDADVENTSEEFVIGLLGPLLTTEALFVKGFYRRPLHDSPSGGGRVTELLARPLIEVCFPELVSVLQPLAGETAAHRWVLEKVEFAEGYAVEMAMLLDVVQRHGVGAIAQVDLGTRIHRNRPLEALRPQAVDILRAALARYEID